MLLYLLRAALREKLSVCCLGVALCALTSFVPHHAFADDPAPPVPTLSDDEIPIINLSDQDLAPDLKKCLEKDSLGDCLKKEAAKQAPIDQSTDTTVDQVNRAWRNFLYGEIVPRDTAAFSKGNQLNFAYNIGGDRLDFDAIALDPNKLATEKNASTPGVWVQHYFDLMPQAGFGLDPKLKTFEKFLGAVVTGNVTMRITKRHPMDQIYDQSFWSYTRQNLKIIGQAFPMYFKILGQTDGQQMLPGEGITFERFGAISIGVGPNISLTGAHPLNIGAVDAGIFATAGLAVNLVRGHFITEMEVQQDNTLRLKLENINQNSEAFQASIDAGVNFAVLTYIKSLLHVEDGIVHTQQKVLDMVVDPKFPAATHALTQAYLGFFDPIQKLALQADTNYQGVRDLGHSSTVAKAHERDFQFFGYDRGSELSESKIDTDDSSESTEVTQNDMTKHRTTSKTQRDLDVRLQADDRVPDPLNHRTLSVRYKFHTQNAKPDELRELLDVARTLAVGDAENHQAEIANWQTELDADHPTSRRGDVQAYFYLALDSSVVSSLFDSADPTKFTRFMTAWAQSLKLPNPSSWAAMSTDAQDDAAQDIAGLDGHLKQLRKFLSAIAKTLKSHNAFEQDQTFAKAIRGEGFDLYPFAALATVSDHAHMLEIERLTISPALLANKTPQTIEIDSLGESYQFPTKALY